MDNFSEKALIDRIIGLRKAYTGHRGRSRFAEALGVSHSTYSYYEKNRVPPIPILLKICQLCNVGIFWLLTGQDESKLAEGQRYDSRFGRLFEKIRKISSENPSSLQAIMAFLELIEQKNIIEGKKIFDREAGAKLGWIPVLGRTAAGPVGMWSETNLTDSRIMETKLEQLVARHIRSSVVRTRSGWVSIDLQTKPVVTALNNSEINLIQTTQDGADEIYQFIDCPAIYRLYPDCFALQVDGDSMAPRINDGDVVIVSPSVPAAQGQPAVVRVEGAIGVMCKLVRIEADRIHLVPINEKYDTKVIKSKDLLWALAVLCHIRLKSVDL